MQKNSFLSIKIPGTNISFKEPFFLHPSGSPTLISEKNKFISNFQDFPFLNIDSTNKKIFFLGGNHVLSKPLIIPKGYQVSAANSFTLDIINKSYIYSQSPFLMISTLEAPIKFISSDHSGSMIILNSTIESQFYCVNFENLNTISSQQLQLTGAITFYESPAKFTNCLFSKNYCEDFLNIIRSEINLTQCVFENSYGDAFDGDFIKGKIEECIFINSQNDAIDVSGSKLSIQLTKISGTGDKGLSIGEKSYLIGNNITLEKCEIGLAVKDSSEATLKFLKIGQSNLGITAYQKKPEFKGATIKIEELKTEEVNVLFLSEKNSMISVDDDLIPNVDKKVNELLNGNQFGKKSK